MNLYISIIEIEENKILFSNNVCLESKKIISLDCFEIEIISLEKIVAINNEKKIVVLFNEIFTLNFKKYVIINNNDNINIINSQYKQKSSFDFLQEDNSIKFLSSLIKKIFNLKINSSYKNSKYFKKIIIFFGLIMFIFSDKSLLNDPIINQDKFKIQKNIYLSIQDFEKNAVQELPQKNIVKIEVKEKQENNPIKKISIHPKSKPFIIHRKELKDNEIQYFLHLNKKN